MKAKRQELETNLENTIKAMEQVKEQIKIFNLKGEELSKHATYLQGKIDILKELEGSENNGE